MRIALAVTIVVAGGIALAYWYEDPFIRRESTFRRLLEQMGPIPDCST
jgi:hypothetical protein